MNPQMFNSFLDGTKSAIEMAAIANACGLDVPEDGLSFPPCGVDDLPTCCARASGRPARRATAWSRWCPRSSATAGRCSATCAGASTWCFKAPNDYAAACFKQYGLRDRRERPLRRDVQALPPDRAGALDLGPSARSARRADRRDTQLARRRRRRSPSATLKAGETLDGEGGYTVYGKLIPAGAQPQAEGALPIGLAHGVALKRDIPAGAIVTKADVRSEKLSRRTHAPRNGDLIRVRLVGHDHQDRIGFGTAFRIASARRWGDIFLASLRRRKDRLHRTVVDLDQGQEISASNRIVRSEASCAALSADAQQSRSTVTL